MGRKGKTTVGTTVPEIYKKLLDMFIEKNKRKFEFMGQKLSRAKVLEIAILTLLSEQGVLEQWMKALGCSDAEISSIKEYLQLVS